MSTTIDDIGHFNDQGKWVSENPSVLDLYRRNHKNERTVLKVQKYRKSRSLNQNNYMWGVVYQHVENDTGMDVDEVHRFCTKKFLTVRTQIVNKKTGEVLEEETIRSTTDLDTMEMETYLEQVRRFFLMELGIRIPLPNETIQ
jgi:hypothetical protein